MVETWVRKGSQVVLTQSCWVSKALAAVCGAVVVGGVAFVTLLLLGWVCQDTDRFVLLCLTACVLGFSQDASSGLLVSVVGLLVLILLPVVSVLLPLVCAAWGLGLLIHQWQIQKGGVL
jgi:hypothetical protein